MDGGIKYAHHDLNDVTQLRIFGWNGETTIVPRDDDSGWVTIEAPARYDDEYWTFSRPKDGELVCFSDSTRSLNRPAPDSPMIVRMPPGKIGEIEIVTEP
jgi:hypothetical protein